MYLLNHLRKFNLCLCRNYGKCTQENFFNLKRHAYILDPDNIKAIKANIAQRKGIGDIELIHSLLTDLRKSNDTTKDTVLYRLEAEISKLPNNTHPAVLNIGNEPKVLKNYGKQRTLSFTPKSFAALCKHLNVLRTDHLGNFCGTRAYYLLNELAELVR